MNEEVPVTTSLMQTYCLSMEKKCTNAPYYLKATSNKNEIKRKNKEKKQREEM